MQDSTEPNTAAGPALVVSLDGALSRSDTGHQAMLAFASSHPTALFSLIGAALSGSKGIRRRLAQAEPVPPGDLLYNESVLDIVRQARSEGRRTALITDGNLHQAEAIQGFLGLFDDVLGPGGTDQNPADQLVAQYGEGGFDYVGSDLPTGKPARKVYAVDAPGQPRPELRQTGTEIEYIAPENAAQGGWQTYLRAMRPHQWSKNLLIFLPALAAHEASALLPALIAFIAFSLTASSVYILNDLFDLAADRRHPRKRNRPFASGAIPLAHGFGLALALLLSALLISAAFAPPLFLAILVGYFALTFLYSLWLKRKLMLDIIILASLYTMRIVAGGVAAAVYLSPWMLSFSMFLFLALAAVKRQSELADQLSREEDAVSGRAYMVNDLNVVLGTAIASGHTAILVFSLYLDSDTVRILYGTPALLWLICPLLLYWILRMIMKTHRGEMTDDPIVFASKDKVTWAVAVISIIVVVLASN